MGKTSIYTTRENQIELNYSICTYLEEEEFVNGFKFKKPKEGVMDDGFIWNTSVEKIVKKYEKMLEKLRQKQEETVFKLKGDHQTSMRQYLTDNEDLRSSISDFMIKQSTLERDTQRMKNDLTQEVGNVKVVEEQYVQKTKDIEHQISKKDEILSAKDVKIREQENTISNLDYTIEEYEKEIVKYMGENKDNEYHKQNSSRMERIATAIDTDIRQLNKSINEHRHKEYDLEQKYKQIGNAVANTKADIESYKIRAKSQYQVMEEWKKQNQEKRHELNQAKINSNKLQQIQEQIKAYAARCDSQNQQLYELQDLLDEHQSNKIRLNAETDKLSKSFKSIIDKFNKNAGEKVNVTLLNYIENINYKLDDSNLNQISEFDLNKKEIIALEDMNADELMALQKQYYGQLNKGEFKNSLSPGESDNNSKIAENSDEDLKSKCAFNKYLLWSLQDNRKLVKALGSSFPHLITDQNCLIYNNSFVANKTKLIYDKLEQLDVISNKLSSRIEEIDQENKEFTSQIESNYNHQENQEKLVDQENQENTNLHNNENNINE